LPQHGFEILHWQKRGKLPSTPFAVHLGLFSKDVVSKVQFDDERIELHFLQTDYLVRII
jgi:hypothetical protein